MDEEIKKVENTEVAEAPKKRTRKKKEEVKPTPKKVWVYFTSKSARGKDKVCLPYALAVKLSKGGQCKIIGE